MTALSTAIHLSKKAEEISLLLSEPDVDLWKLRELALTEGGLVNSEWNPSTCTIESCVVLMSRL